MIELVKFECPRCERPYELSLDLEKVRNKRQRAKCARCGERFDIASRVEAMRIGAPEPTEAPAQASSAVAARLAAALRGTTSQDREPELIGGGSDEDIDHQEFKGDGPPTVSSGAPESLAKAFQAQIASTDQASEIESTSKNEEEAEAEEIEEEEIEEAAFPEPLDWLAAAGTGLEILNRELSERERELAELVTH